MTNKDKYRQLCAMESTIPLFSQDWWLDCVCGEDKWDVLLIEKNNVIEASFPFYMPVSKAITMPLLTQTMGIWFNPAFTHPKYDKELFRKQRLCEELIQQLPTFSSFLQNFHHTFTDWLPFYWAGFKQTTRYTYLLQDILDKENLWNQFNEDARRNIQKAKNKHGLEIKQDLPVDDYLKIVAKTYERQGKTSYHIPVLKRLIEVVLSRNQGKIWGAYDSENRLHAAIFIVWQNDCAYLLSSGGDPELRKSGGKALARWQAFHE
jgi:lipid II:glycine glycyltransferase (peptidoglycan interpeptide bridge formation enzyme)